MKNSVIATVEFCFKGQTLTPSAQIDLDAYFQAQKEPESCYLEIAKVGDVGLYSYEFEVMLSEPIVFSEPTGIALDCVSDGKMDWEKLEQAWSEFSGLREVGSIANKIFNVENINTHPKLAAALMEAYQKGYEVASKEERMNKGMNEGFYG